MVLIVLPEFSVSDGSVTRLLEGGWGGLSVDCGALRRYQARVEGEDKLT
jgi:hypothetical protein